MISVLTTIEVKANCFHAVKILAISFVFMYGGNLDNAVNNNIKKWIINHYRVYTDLDNELKAVYSYGDNKEPAKMPCCQSDTLLITQVEESI